MVLKESLHTFLNLSALWFSVLDSFDAIIFYDAINLAKIIKTFRSSMLQCSGGASEYHSRFENNNKQETGLLGQNRSSPSKNNELFDLQAGNIQC